MANYVLEILDGDRAGEVLPVGASIIRIGRKAGNDIVLTDEKTSGVHCEILPEGDRLVLKDLGSTNRTFLDGKRLSELVLTPWRHRHHWPHQSHLPFGRCRGCC